MTSTNDTAKSGTGLDMVPTLSDTKIVRALQYANEWLRYGEQKHAALLALNGATLTALNNLAKPEAKASSLLVGLFALAVVACVVSIGWSLSSFYAQTNPKKVLMSRGAADRPATNTWTDWSADRMGDRLNWVYFGHLAKRNAKEIVAGLVGRYESGWDDGYLLDMAEQVVINSRLALMKALRFNSALKAYTIAPVLLLLLLFAK